MTFERLMVGSFVHSTIYLCLLAAWLLPGLEGPTYWLGWGHGVGWIAMSLLALVALRRGVIPLRIALAVAVIGAVGPFVGSYEFVRARRVVHT